MVGRKCILLLLAFGLFLHLISCSSLQALQGVAYAGALVADEVDKSVQKKTAENKKILKENQQKFLDGIVSNNEVLRTKFGRLFFSTETAGTDFINYCKKIGVDSDVLFDKIYEVAPDYSMFTEKGDGFNQVWFTDTRRSSISIKVLADAIYFDKSIAEDKCDNGEMCYVISKSYLNGSDGLKKSYKNYYKWLERSYELGYTQSFLDYAAVFIFDDDVSIQTRKQNKIAKDESKFGKIMSRFYNVKGYYELIKNDDLDAAKNNFVLAGNENGQNVINSIAEAKFNYSDEDTPENLNVLLKAYLSSVTAGGRYISYNHKDFLMYGGREDWIFIPQSEADYYVAAVMLSGFQHSGMNSYFKR